MTRHILSALLLAPAACTDDGDPATATTLTGSASTGAPPGTSLAPDDGAPTSGAATSSGSTDTTGAASAGGAEGPTPTESTSLSGTSATAGAPDLPSPSLCGNNLIDPGEECDQGEANFPPGYQGDEYNACVDCALVHTCADGERQPEHEMCDCHPLGDPDSECEDKNGTLCYQCQFSVRYVFVTSEETTGLLGGLTGAHARCNALAEKSPALAGRTFAAWLSDGCHDPRDWLSEAPKPGFPPPAPYVLVGENSVVVDSFQDLAAEGVLGDPITRDEHGEVTQENFVWSNVNATGEAHSLSVDCKNWDSADPDAVGRLGYIGDPVHWSVSLVPGWDTSPCSTPRPFYCFEQSLLQQKNSPDSFPPCDKLGEGPAPL